MRGGLRRRLCLVALACISPTLCFSQSTQGWLAGSVADAITAQPIAGAEVRCVSTAKGTEIVFTTDPSGWFVFANLSPGEYTISVAAAGYQTQEYDQLEMPVAGQIEMEFRTLPLGFRTEAIQKSQVFVPGTNRILAFYGPDLDLSRRQVVEPDRVLESNLEPSVSTVISTRDLRELPLPSRDAYTLLVLLPGVTSNNSTARGLGFSVSGQRPSSANYLLDGLENNNLLTTGPLGAVVPEFLEEYRISTNNFSAEYGRTAGFLANAITRGGSNVWRGDAFVQWKNEALNANGFQENTRGIERAALKETRPGFTASGPILRDRLFVSGSLQLARFRSRRNPQVYALPTASFLSSLPATGDGATLLRTYHATIVPDAPGKAAPVEIAAPVESEQLLSLARVDWINANGNQRVAARGSVSRNRQPYLLYSPYPGFSSPFHQGAVSVGAAWTWQLSSALSEEFRIGRIGDSVRYDRPHPEVPTLVLTDDLVDDNYAIELPTSLSSFGYRNRTSNWELVNNWTYLIGRHRLKAGGGFFSRQIDSIFTVDRDGRLLYEKLEDLVRDTPFRGTLADDISQPGFQSPPYGRNYRYNQGDFFIQDSVQLTRRIGLTIGLRADWLGAPVNTGVNKDVLIQFGAGSTMAQRLAGTFYAPLPVGDQTVFEQHNLTWAPRLGLSYDLTGTGSTLLRASYGIYYDRFFDALWQVDINREQMQSFRINPGSTIPFLTSLVPSVVSNGRPDSINFHRGLLFQPDLRNPMIQSAFVGVQHRLSRGISLEANVLASRGSGLLTSDLLNRRRSVGTAQFNPALPELYYRGNQGISQYTAATFTARFNRSRWSGLVAYTVSHAKDNQSDPLVGVFEQFDQAGLAGKGAPLATAAFTRQFDSRADYGNADFDQRHNLVFFGVYELPALSLPSRLSAFLNGWRISGLGAIRSGLPFSVLAQSAGVPTGGGVLYNQRADLVDAASIYRVARPDIAGGRRLLNQAAFAPPSAASVGNTARNAFYGPGLINLDLSLAKRIALPLTETSRLTLRADVFNALNHANLNSPQNNYYLNFGDALYGRRDKSSGFPSIVPFNETSRQVQLFLEVEF